jgi:hypothetical protein
LKPSDIPEQRSYNMNGVVETRKRFEKALNEAMKMVAVDTYHGVVDKKNILEPLRGEYDRFFNSMKGATNIHVIDVEELVDHEISRQKVLYSEIDTLEEVFEGINILDPSGLAAYPYWSHGPSHGVNININGTWFYALPRVPCSTDEYITVKQAPVSANIVLVNKNMILMLPYREDPIEKTRRQLNTLFTQSGQMDEEGFSEPIKVRTNYLWTHSEKKIDEQLIDETMRKYKADAFMVGYPGRNLAILYTGLEETLETLWKSLYFDWGEMYGRYGWYE